MPKLTPISSKKMLKLLKLLGFELLRIKGSHHFFFNSALNRSAVVPVHGNRELSIGILVQILKDIDLSVDEYEKLRKKL